MSGSTPDLTQMSAATSQREVVFNSVANAASPATLGGRNDLTCTGLTWGYYGGNYVAGGGVTHINDGTINLTASATNYIELNPASGAITANTTGFTAGRIPLYTAVAGASTVTSWTDHRAWGCRVDPRLAISFATDANVTLTQAQAAADLLDVTSSATLTATRDLVVPLFGKIWTVRNGTTGAQSIRLIGATGTGVTVANGKVAMVFCDGTNVVRVTPDT